MDGARRREPERFEDLGSLEKAVLACYAVGEAAFPILVFGGLLLVVAGFRGGAYLLIVGLVAHFAARDLFAAVTVRREGELDALAPFERALLAIGFTSYLVAFVAAGAAVWGSRGAVYLALAGVLANFVAHLVVAVSFHARVMSRPWPAVQALGPDDDDDW